MQRNLLRAAAFGIAAVLTTPSIAAGSSIGGGGSRASRPAPVVDPGDAGRYAPIVDPAQFVERIDNAYLPLLPRTRWVYEGRSDGETERTVVTVLDERKRVMGISAVVVRDTVSVNGVVVEDTRDWFAQDRAGNVWYLGEAVKNYKNGKFVDASGSWAAGVDGALPGIVMPATPRVGDAFRQEYYVGEAEDMFEIIRIGSRAEVPAGGFADVLVTRDWTPLEPEVVEQKYYARGLGMIREKHVAGSTGLAELVRYRPAPTAR